MTKEDIKSIYGYDVEELIIFADACRKAGILPHELHAFILNAGSAYTYVENRLKEEFEAEIKRILHH